jgi:archaellin
MKRRILKKEEGAIGIGTLIVFIALILVAAIAAAVIIGTAEDLEERGEEAAEDARDVVKQTPRMIRAEGQVNAASQIQTIEVYIDYIGSEGVDMSNVVVHVLATQQGGQGAKADLTLDEGAPDTADDDNYGIEEVADPLDHYDPDDNPPRFILGETTQLKLIIDLSLCAVTLPPDSDLRIEITTTDSGGRSISVWETPSAYPQQNGWVILQD